MQRTNVACSVVIGIDILLHAMRLIIARIVQEGRRFDRSQSILYDPSSQVFVGHDRPLATFLIVLLMSQTSFLQKPPADFLSNVADCFDDSHCHNSVFVVGRFFCNGLSMAFVGSSQHARW